MNLALCFASATRGQALTVLCASSTKASLRVCLNAKGDGNNRCLSCGCSANTDSAWAIVRDGGKEQRGHTANTPSCSEGVLCVCVCEHTRARVNALVPVHNCSHIQIWRHTLSQRALFNFHRYVNSSAKACI